MGNGKPIPGGAGGEEEVGGAMKKAMESDGGPPHICYEEKKNNLKWKYHVSRKKTGWDVAFVDGWKNLMVHSNI